MAPMAAVPPWAAMPSTACPTASPSTSPTRRFKPGRSWHQPPCIRSSFALLAVLASLSCVSLAQRDALPAQVTSSDRLVMIDRSTTTPQVPRGWDVAHGSPLEARDGQGQIDKVEPTPANAVLPVAATTPFPLPSPFDNRQPSDFKIANTDDKCPNFITGLLSNPTFKGCYPFSMLIQTSRGLFEAETNLLSIVRVLDAACRADVSSCTDFLDQAAQNLTTEANCKAEVDQGQPIVLQAWRGLKAYRTIYSATCLQDSSSMYCFANAITNLTTPYDSYLYSLPYGLSLPNTSTPSCNNCTREIMNIYWAASANRQQFVASKYEDAAKRINAVCNNTDFVNATLPAVEAGAHAMSMPPYSAALATVCAVVLALGFVF